MRTALLEGAIFNRAALEGATAIVEPTGEFGEFLGVSRVPFAPRRRDTGCSKAIRATARKHNSRRDGHSSEIAISEVKNR